MSESTRRQDAENEMIEAVAAALGEIRGTAPHEGATGEPSEPVFLHGTPDAPVLSAPTPETAATDAASMAAEIALTAAPDALELAPAELESPADDADQPVPPAEMADMVAPEAADNALADNALAVAAGAVEPGPAWPQVERKIAALERFRARWSRKRKDPGASPDPDAGISGADQPEHPAGEAGSPDDAVTFRLLGELDRLWQRAA